MSDLVARFQLQSQRLAERGPGGSIEFLLEQLKPESARYLRLCAIPHQFDLHILQVIAPELDKGQAEMYCEEFSILPVITFNQDGMALHDKARHYLFQQWTTPPVSKEFTDASQRLAAYFAERCEKSRGEQQRNDTIRRVFHLIGSNPNIGFDEFQTLCRQMRRQFRLNDCENLIKLAHEYDQILSPEQQMWLVYHEGKLAADRCQWELAEQSFRKILSSKASSPLLCAMAYNRLGIILDEKRDFHGAIGYYNKALEIAKSLPHAHRYEYRILHDLGVAQRDGGDLKTAEALLGESISLAEKMKNPSGIAMGYNSLGTLYRKRRKTKQAIDFYEKSLKYLKDSGDTFRPAQVYNNLGLVYAEMSNWEASREFLEKSLVITRQAGDALGQAKTQNNLVRVYQNLKQNDRAIEAAQAAIKLFEEMRENYSAALAKRNLGKLYHRMKRRDLASQAYTKAIESFERSKEIMEANATRRELEALYQKVRFPWLILIIITALFIILLFVIEAMTKRTPYYY